VRVGHGTAPLPVPDGTPMGGYAAREGASSGVLDPLQVDVVAIGGFTLVVADALQIEEAIPGAWVCATHTHAGPERAELADAVASVALEEREVTCRFHTGWLDGIGSRRGADRPARVRVDVLSFGEAWGVLAIVPVHPTVLPAANTRVSADLHGAIRRALAREFDWAVVATGAAGDISTRRTRRAQTPAECERLGAEAARQIAALVRTPPDAEWSSGAVATASCTLALPAREQDAGALAALRDSLEADYARAPDRTLETALQGVALASARASLEPVPLVLSAARLGPLTLYGIGGEPFHSLREALPGALLGYVNGHAGYLPDAAAFAAPGYEVLASPLRPDAAALAVAALIELTPDPTEA
jgi:neutral ceramidase